MTSRTKRRSGAGRPRNDPGPEGWSPTAAHHARLEAHITIREIRDTLEDRFAITLSARAVEHYFLPPKHPSSRAPFQAAATAIAKILGVDREELGAAGG